MCDYWALREPFAHPDVVAWAEGRSSTVPCAEQSVLDVAATARDNLLLKFEAQGDYSSLARFPEWLWGHGLLHDPPKFGHRRIQHRAIERRWGTIKSLFSCGNLSSLLEFPEWRRVTDYLQIAEQSTMLEMLLNVEPPQEYKRYTRRHLLGKRGPRQKYLRTLLLLEVNAVRVLEDLPKTAPASRPSVKRETGRVRFDASRTAVQPMGWHPPEESVLAWMEGRLHERPVVRSFGLFRRYDPGPVATTYFTNRRIEVRRRETFLNACRTMAADIFLWPEFDQELRKLHLQRLYRRGLISMEVACVFIVQQNRSYALWQKRAKRLRQEGKDPLKRSGYRRAERQFYEAIIVAKRTPRRDRFEQVMRRAMDA